MLLPRPHRRRAFTLLEIMLVMAVVAMLAGMLAPSLTGSRKRQRLESQARAVVGLARKARALAAGEGRAYVLVVDPTGRELRLVRRRDPLAEPDDPKDPEHEVPALERWSLPIAFEEDVQLEGAVRDDVELSLTGSQAEELIQIPFRPDGTSDAVELAFKLGEDLLAVAIDRNLGEARILPPVKP